MASGLVLHKVEVKVNSCLPGATMGVTWCDFLLTLNLIRASFWVFSDLNISMIMITSISVT